MRVEGTRMYPGHMKRAAGISLLELVITVAVAGILLAIAMPSFTGVINNNRLTSSSNTLVTAMHYARSEAVRRNGRVIVCPSADGATCSASGNWQDWITLATSSTGDEVLRNHGVEAPVQMSSTIQRVSFRADGLARDAAGNLLAGNFIACIPTNRPVENQRVIAVASGSRFSTDSADGSGACP